jgi:hypothetical protein
MDWKEFSVQADLLTMLPLIERPQLFYEVNQESEMYVVTRHDGEQ